MIEVLFSSTDYLYIANLILKLLGFFSGYCRSYFPLMWTKVFISCKIQTKITNIFSYPA